MPLSSDDDGDTDRKEPPDWSRPHHPQSPEPGQLRCRISSPPQRQKKKLQAYSGSADYQQILSPSAHDDDPLDWSQRSSDGPRLRISSPVRRPKKLPTIDDSSNLLLAPNLGVGVDADDDKYSSEKKPGGGSLRPASSTSTWARRLQSALFPWKGAVNKPQIGVLFILFAVVLVETALISYLMSRPSSSPSFCSHALNDDVASRSLRPEGRTSVNVLFGLKGAKPGFMKEFEVAFKSVLLNAPMEYDMHVHIMADGFAHDSLGRWFQSVELLKWRTRNQINITTYHCSSLLLQSWRQRIFKLSNDVHMGDRQFLPHTIGAWFRLFAYQVLPLDNVENVLYLDTDVIIMADIGELWRRIDSDRLFHIGESESSGFIVLNLRKTETIWKMASTYDLRNITDLLHTHAGDQLLLRAIKLKEPSLVGTLPQEWDLSVANQIWKYKKTLVKERPKVGMLHFSGGGSQSKEAYFDEHDFLNDPKLDNSWGVAKYYIRVPWPWARFIAHSVTRDGIGYQMLINHREVKRKAIPINPIN